MRTADIASERVLNEVILAGEMSENYEEYLEIFDHFYAGDIKKTNETLKEPVVGRPPYGPESRISYFRFTSNLGSR